MGYAAAPVVKTRSAGWLYAWSWSIQQASKKKDNAWKFISWASSRQYEELVGSQLGWSKAIESADPRNPGVQPRPAIGIQFVDIPEFTDLATQVSQYVSSSIAGQMSVDQALNRGQGLAGDVAERYRARAKK